MEALRAGRNDLCPCGSGRKSKRCCRVPQAGRGVRSIPALAAPQPVFGRERPTLTLDRLRDPSEEDLARFDIAEVDLVCATELPGSERLDIPTCLAWIDHAAAWARHQTHATLDQFASDPAAYNHSEGLFRVMAIDSVLRGGIGVRYNPDVMADLDRSPIDSRDDFLHGIIEGWGGTCASLPVLYVAVGRRLGYPLRLVTTARHLFARWDNPRGERFNIEISNAGGVDTHPDDHYLDWLVPIRGTEWEEIHHRRSLTPRGELTQLWAKRGFCLRANGLMREAVKAIAIAWSLSPDDVLCGVTMQQVMKEWKVTFPTWIKRRRRLNIDWPPRQYPGLPVELEQDIIELDVYERLLKDNPTALCGSVIVQPASF